MTAGYETWREVNVREVGVAGLLEFQIRASADLMMSSESLLDTEAKLRVMTLSEELMAKARTFDWTEIGPDAGRKIKFMAAISSSLALAIAGVNYIAEFETHDGLAVTDMNAIHIEKVRILRPKEGQ